MFAVENSEFRVHVGPDRNGISWAVEWDAIGVAERIAVEIEVEQVCHRRRFN